jgi:hypothetical protein
VAILVLPLAAARPAAACSCVAASDERRLADSVAVFSGEVAGREGVGADLARPGDAASIWTFTVSRVFKGTLGPTVRVVSPLDGMSCGIELPSAGPALVFAQEPGGLVPPVPGIALAANLCNGTRSLAASPVPASFGGGADPGRPAPAPSTARSTKAPEPPWAVIGGTAGAVALAAVLVVGRRRARRSSAS